MDEPIKNSWDLRQEIIRLKGVEKVQGEAIAERFNSPAAIFSTLFSLFPKSPNTGENKSSIFNQDFVSILSRFLIPITLNKTIFKHSGFLIKALVGLVSQKASGYVNEESVVGIFDKVKALFTKKRTYAKEHYPYSL